MTLNRLLPIGIALELLVLITSYFESSGDTTAFFQAAARLSGRVSLLFFTFYFIYSTLNPSVKALSVKEYPENEGLKTKYILSRDFAIIHLIHWVFLAIAVKLSGFELVPYRVAGGALAYFMVVAMPFILKKKIFTNFSLRVTEGVYIFYVWLIFFMTYLPRIRGHVPTATGNMQAYYILIIFTIGLILWRIFMLLKRKLV
jgi:hypothetical protein